MKFRDSNAFYNLLTPTSEVYVGESFISPEESSNLQKELLYQLILQQLYNYQVGKNKEWIHEFINGTTGLVELIVVILRLNVTKH